MLEVSAATACNTGEAYAENADKEGSAALWTEERPATRGVIDRDLVAEGGKVCGGDPAAR